MCRESLIPRGELKVEQIHPVRGATGIGTLEVRKRLTITDRLVGHADGSQLYAARHEERHDDDVEQYEHVRVVRHQGALGGVEEREIVVVEAHGHREQDVENVQPVRRVGVRVLGAYQQRRYHPERARAAPQRGEEVREPQAPGPARPEHVPAVPAVRAQEVDGREVHAAPDGVRVAHQVVRLAQVVYQHHGHHGVMHRAVVVVQAPVHAPAHRRRRRRVDEQERDDDELTRAATAVHLHRAGIEYLVHPRDLQQPYVHYAFPLFVDHHDAATNH